MDLKKNKKAMCKQLVQRKTHQKKWNIQANIKHMPDSCAFQGLLYVLSYKNNMTEYRGAGKAG